MILREVAVPLFSYLAAKRAKFGSKKAVIIKFPGASDVEAFFTVEKDDGSKDTSAYEKAEKDGWINGNCVIITASSDCLGVFKEA